MLVLYAYDNTIAKIEVISLCTRLTCLYLQHNNISAIQNIRALVSLRKLYFESLHACRATHHVVAGTSGTTVSVW